ncbi:hypothetical protein FOL47_004242 [Perkinsus chesapeaki]|uniref:Uncharacterized protein n=1 Tax=Perkinsus chesapeaki TaxID=330153 RepID=A0A7J6M3N1_PERCH|nr:hypothetical protein FOL47_004242 [Perkinsus chesapeaki]
MVEAIFNLAIDLRALKSVLDHSCPDPVPDVQSVIWEYLGHREPRGMTYASNSARSRHGRWEDKILRCKLYASIDPLSHTFYKLHSDSGVNELRVTKVSEPFKLPEIVYCFDETPPEPGTRIIPLNFRGRGLVSVNSTIVAYRGKVYVAGLHGPLSLTAEEEYILGKQRGESDWYGPCAFYTEFKELCPISGEQRTVGYASMFVREFDVIEDTRGNIKIVAVDSYDYQSFVGVLDDCGRFNIFEWEGFLSNVRFVTLNTLLFMKKIRGAPPSPMGYVQSFYHFMAGVEPSDLVLLRLPDGDIPAEEIEKLPTQLGFGCLFKPYYFVASQTGLCLPSRRCVAGSEICGNLRLVY